MSAATTAAPQTHKQSSRKGKRAWRKNVDITEIQTGLQEAREQITLTGGKLLADVDSSELFQTDTTGSVQLKSQVRKIYPQLKADEIIAQRSALPAVNTRKRPGADDLVTDGVLIKKPRRMDGVSHKELDRLKQIAFGGEKEYKDVVSIGDAASYDPWAIVPTEPVPLTANYIDEAQPVRAPRTLSKPPISLTSSGKPLPNVPKPSSGRSYNPAFSDWSALLDREGAKELQAERKRLAAAEAETERLERVAAATAEAEREELRDAALSEYDESEWEGFQSELEEAQLKRKRPERKTPAERNKINRRKEAERLAKHERKTKERDEQAKRIEAIRRDLDTKKTVPTASTTSTSLIPTPSSDSEPSDPETGEHLRRRRLGRIRIPPAPLELVLSDELQDSLRRLKPEGNLLSERFRNMLVQGKVEARAKIWQPKRRKVQRTEKWGYKDWKLRGREG